MAKKSKSAALTAMTPPGTPGGTVAVPTVAVDLSQVEDMIAEGTVVAVHAKVEASDSDILAMAGDDVAEMGQKGRGMILGVSTLAVVKAFAASLVQARLNKDPVPLIYVGVLAVAMAYTVSREWVDEYDNLPEDHMMATFEIEGRKKVAKTGDSEAVDWVANSNMNASAFRIFGSMIVEAGTSSAFLVSLKESGGTIFNAKDGVKTRDKFMKEAAKDVSEADRAALEVFKKVAVKYAAVVGHAFGGGGANLVTYEAAMAKLDTVYI